MDPLSLTASIVGVGSAGISLSSALFDLISGYRGAPRDMAEIARNVSDLSMILDALTAVLKDGKKLYRRKLLKSVDSAVQRIDDIHEEIWDLVDDGKSSLARLKWVFRSTKTAKLLLKIEAQKSMLQIVIATLHLALEQRKCATREKSRDDDGEGPAKRRRLRSQAENMVRMGHQALRDLAGDVQQPKDEPRDDADDMPDGQASPDDQIQLYGDKPDDTGLWLYKTVFSTSSDENWKASSDDTLDPSSSTALILRETDAMNQVATRRAKVADVVDNLLYDWTNVEVNEIHQISREAAKFENGNESHSTASTRELPFREEPIRYPSGGSAADTASDSGSEDWGDYEDNLKSDEGDDRAAADVPSQSTPPKGHAAVSPLDQLSAIHTYMRTKVQPLHAQFTVGHPSDRRTRDTEYRKLSEMIMQQVLLKLDDVDAEGNDAIRMRRKELVRQAQSLLSSLDITRGYWEKSQDEKSRSDTEASGPGGAREKRAMSSSTLAGDFRGTLNGTAAPIYESRPRFGEGQSTVRDKMDFAAEYLRKSSVRSATPTRRFATEADAKKSKIPAGYSLKSWDPTKEPILLLGSVFDAESIGKWIHDWATYHYQNGPITDMASELKELLLRCSTKTTRAEAAIPQIKKAKDRGVVEHYVESAERLTVKLRRILKTCEQSMLRSAAEKNNRDEQVKVGAAGGLAFVRTMFGRKYELEKTEDLMASMRLWNLRFDASCEYLIGETEV